MNDWLIFFWIILCFASISFWEAYAEGRHGGASQQVGWKLKVGKYFFTAYHFHLFAITIPLFLFLPLVAFGWSGRLMAIIASGFLVGVVVEDFLWFVINPVWPLRDFNSEKVTWFPWLKIGKFELPIWYLPFLILAMIIWNLWVK